MLKAKRAARLTVVQNSIAPAFSKQPTALAISPFHLGDHSKDSQQYVAHLAAG